MIKLKSKKFVVIPRDALSDPAVKLSGEKWEYLGNIFEMLPYSVLAGEPQPR